MNLDLAENTNKLILLVVAGVALLLTLNTYQKQVGKNLAVVLSIVTIVVVGYVAFTLMNKKPVANNANNVNLANNLVNDLVNSNNNLNLNNIVANNNRVNNVRANNVRANNVAANNVTANNVAANNVATNNADVVENFESGMKQKRRNAAVAATVEKFQGNNNANNDDDEEPKNNSNHPADNGVLKCSDLLPGDTNSTWAQVSPSGVGELCTKNLLNAGHHIGVNTQGCSLRNANRGLRSEPPNPQVQVSPWLQTTICPDLLRRPLE